MDPEELLREHVLKVLTDSAPEGFWRGLQDRSRTLYLGEFAAVAEDQRLNESQRLSKLWQDRHFKMEWLLVDEATKNGLAASANVIERNGCSYALVSAGGVSMTQHYVQFLGDKPPPAKFRSDLAAINEFQRQGALLFGDEPAELFLPKAINGLILHSPCGPRLNEEHQKLAGMGFYVPDKDFKSWAAQLTFAEIINAYATPVDQADRVKPVLRKDKDDGKSAESAG